MTEQEKTGGTMNCGVVSELLQSFHAGKLNARAEQSVQEHLSGCAACSVRLASLERQSKAHEEGMHVGGAGAQAAADAAPTQWWQGIPKLALLAIGLALVVVPGSLWFASSRVRSNDAPSVAEPRRPIPPRPPRAEQMRGELAEAIATATAEAMEAARIATVEAARTSRTESAREMRRMRADAAIVARLTRVGDDEDLREPFSLDNDAGILVYALGEATGGEMHDYAWIEDAATGRMVWRMTYEETSHAGGADKNRVAEEIVHLDEGDYVLRYRSDDSHSFESWNSTAPPDEANYGVTLFLLDGR